MQTHHPVLLTYLQPRLEAAFVAYHNRAVAKLEQLGGRLGSLVIALYYITNICRGAANVDENPVDNHPRVAQLGPTSLSDSGQPTPFHLTIMTYLALTTCIEIVRFCQPALFARYREHMQLIKRFICYCIACTVQEEVSAQSSGGSIFNYGMTAALFSAFENKLVYSLVTHVIGCLAMIIEDNATPAKMLLHAVTVAYVPATCVFLWDRRVRAAFLQTAEARQIMQQHAGRPGQQRAASMPSSSH